MISWKNATEQYTFQIRYSVKEIVIIKFMSQYSHKFMFDPSKRNKR